MKTVVNFPSRPRAVPVTALLPLLPLLACTGADEDAGEDPSASAPEFTVMAGEPHPAVPEEARLRNVRQLTFGDQLPVNPLLPSQPLGTRLLVDRRPPLVGRPGRGLQGGFRRRAAGEIVIRLGCDRPQAEGTRPDPFPAGEFRRQNAGTRRTARGVRWWNWLHGCLSSIR